MLRLRQQPLEQHSMALCCQVSTFIYYKLMLCFLSGFILLECLWKFPKCYSRSAKSWR